jgi:hypothetical protein
MQRFSKQTQEFLGAAWNNTKVLSMIPPSPSRMVPGEILIFRYFLGVGPGSRGQRVALIVKTRRGDGLIKGREGNLVTCFKLLGNSEEVVSAIVDNLYKKRRRASYYGKIKQSLIKLLGIDSYRTYKLTQMKDIFKVSLGK